MDLSGKVALVTGGSRGIGRATALALARAGADVVVNYIRNHGAAMEVVQGIEALGKRAVAVCENVGVPSEVEALFARTDEAFGPRSALGRVGTQEDVADTILFFASDYCRHVTGQMILVDGGIYMP